MTAARLLLPELHDLTPREAERWIAAALSEAAALHERDDRLYPLTDDAAGMKHAQRLHGAWVTWADEAESLVARIATLPGGKRQHVAGLYDLRVEIGKARGITSMTPQEFLRRSGRYQSGETRAYAAEELRRELDADDHR